MMDIASHFFVYAYIDHLINLLNLFRSHKGI